jgi:hypothetical protein
MSPDLAFILSLVVRMAVTAAFVVGASVLSERSGPVIGALVATLPISAGPSYVFLALDHDASFIFESTLASLPINAVTILFCAAYAWTAQRQNSLVSCAVAVSVWLVLAWLARTVQWSFAGGILANVMAYAICLPMLERYRRVKMLTFTRRWYDIPLRATLVATLVATVITLSHWVGPNVSGTIALFPVVFTSMMLILQPRIGGPSTAAVFANSGWGLVGLGIGVATIHVTVVPLGAAAALSLALTICVIWNISLWGLSRRAALR